MISRRILRVGEGHAGVQHRRAVPSSVAVEGGLDGLAGGEFHGLRQDAEISDAIGSPTPRAFRTIHSSKLHHLFPRLSLCSSRHQSRADDGIAASSIVAFG